MTQGESSLPRSVVSLVRTGLSHLVGVENAPQFMVALIRGLGSNLTLLSRELFAKQVIIKMKKVVCLSTIFVFFLF